jgi:trk system potassium uptake protein TrkA
MALINRPSYAELVETGNIDVAVSPRQVTIGSLLEHVRKGDVVKVHALRRGRAEAMEAVAHNESGRSKVVGRQIDEIKLPPGSSISAIVRGDQVMEAHHDTVVEENDHVILFLTDRRHVDDVERLFQTT